MAKAGSNVTLCVLRSCAAWSGGAGPGHLTESRETPLPEPHMTVGLLLAMHLTFRCSDQFVLL